MANLDLRKEGQLSLRKSALVRSHIFCLVDLRALVFRLNLSDPSACFDSTPMYGLKGCFLPDSSGLSRLPDSSGLSRLTSESEPALLNQSSSQVLLSTGGKRLGLLFSVEMGTCAYIHAVQSLVRRACSSILGSHTLCCLLLDVLEREDMNSEGWN